MHLEREILKNKHFKPHELKKEAREEIREVAHTPMKESREAKKFESKHAKSEALKKKKGYSKHSNSMMEAMLEGGLRSRK
jgi:dsDNA-specific endonuclease/ATPase MutS2